MDAQPELPANETPKAPLRPTRWQLLNSSPWMKGVRLTGFVAAIAALGVGLTYSRVRGQVGEQMITMGESLMRYERAERQDAPRELRLNGQSLMVTSGTSPDDLDVVLDEFEARCRAHNPELQAQIRAASAQDFFVMREERDGVGAVGCLDFGQEISAAELLGRAARFRQSNDLARGICRGKCFQTQGLRAGGDLHLGQLPASRECGFRAHRGGDCNGIPSENAEFCLLVAVAIGAPR